MRAIYINSTTVSVLHKKTPYEPFLRRGADNQNIFISGGDAFIHVYKSQRACKLANHAMKGT